MPETEQHMCAFKLLPDFFGKEELGKSNTDGRHAKKCLNGNKLNSLRILVFSKFLVSRSEEKDKAWRIKKGKMNSKSCATRRILLQLYSLTFRITTLMIIFLGLENIAFYRQLCN